jgi:hypothetical protein
MKNSIQLTIALVLMVSVAFANDPDGIEATGMKVEPQEMGIFKLIYQTSKARQLEIKIINENGQTIHEEVLKASKSFTRSYNLKNYSSGSYVFQTIDKNGTKTQTVSHDRSRGITMYSLGNTKKVKLIVAEPDQELVVNIYDRSGKFVEQDKLQSGLKGVRKVYDLSKRRAGDTIIEVMNGFEVVSKLTI